MKRMISMGLLFAGLGIAAFAEDKGSWTDNLQWNGDFRYRHESIQKEGTPDRNRQRIRARFGMKAKVNDEVDATIQLATGSTDPISTNQSLGEGFSHKGVQIDLAFVDFHPKDSVPGLDVYAGKMKNPFLTPSKSELIWDHDLTPEGGALTYSVGDDVKFIGKAGGFWAEERAATSDAILSAVQALLQFKMGDAVLSAGASYFGYSNLKGETPIFDPKVSFGNSTASVGTILLPKIVYTNDYKEVEGFVELESKFADIPVGVFGDYVKNQDASGLAKGYLCGFNVGKVKDPGSAAFKYYYKKLEKDAVLGAFADSDFGGGGTDSKGHKFAFEYGLAKNWNLGLNYFMNKAVLAHPIDYKRAQVDLQFKF